MERNVLTIKGSRKRGETETTYERSFRVADQIDSDNVTAVMEDGVLRVSLTKKKAKLKQKKSKSSKPIHNRSSSIEELHFLIYHPIYIDPLSHQ